MQAQLAQAVPVRPTGAAMARGVSAGHGRGALRATHQAKAPALRRRAAATRDAHAQMHVRTGAGCSEAAAGTGAAAVVAMMMLLGWRGYGEWRCACARANDG